MSSGGAREGAGRKHKYVDAQGKPLETKSVRIPKIIDSSDIQKLIYEKLKKEKTKDKPS